LGASLHTLEPSTCVVGFHVLSSQLDNGAITFYEVVVERSGYFVDASHAHCDHVVGVGVAVGGGVVYDYSEGF